MKNKTIAILLTLALSAALFTGCSDPAANSTTTSSSETTAETSESTEEASASITGQATTAETAEAYASAMDLPDFSGMEASDFKVALLVPDSITEEGWSKTGADAMEKVAELGCTTTIIEASTTDVMKSESEALADDGYNLIIGHGSQYEDAFAEICEDYPDTIFITVGGTTFSANLFPYTSAIQEPYYLAGMMAALLTETNQLGFVAGADWDSFTKSGYSFKEGALLINPDIEFTMTILNDSSDMNEGYEAALALINAGCDVVATSANSAGTGVVQACQDNGAYAVDHGGDFTELGPDAVYVNIYDTFEPCFASFVTKLLDGTFEVDPSGDTSFGYYDGYWDMEYTTILDLPDEVLDILPEYKEAVASGELSAVSEFDLAIGKYIPE